MRRAGTAPPAPRVDAARGPHGLLRVAHRGASRTAPENTLAAFREAIRLGVDAIEIDVHLSADGRPIVIHDDTLDRTTSGRGPVGALSAAELRRLDAGAWFSPRFRGESVPTLEETLECVRGRCGLNIEIKEAQGSRPRRAGGRAAMPSPTGLVARAVARAVARTGFKDLLIVSSFSGRALEEARAAMPETRLGFLASRSLRGLRRLHWRLRLFSVHPHLRLIAPRRMALAHRLGLLVIVWTVNDARRMRRLAALGADGLMTDDPALFRALS